MAYKNKDISSCKLAVNFILDDDWEKAHAIVQEIDNDIAQWIHAVLHKIEGDSGNSRYWYAKSSMATYEKFANPNKELLHILEQINFLAFPE